MSPSPSAMDIAGLVKGSLDWYVNSFATCKINENDLKTVEFAAEQILSNEERYKFVQGMTGIPWYLVGALHNLEASCSFACVLHNGERIIGTGKKTTLVPAGRGPFSSWESAAIDALTLDGLTSVKAWPLEVCLREAESYNGLGYLQHHPDENSPYLWACTSMNDGAGKYVEDGSFDPTAPTSGQAGVAAIFKYLEQTKVISFYDRAGKVI